MVNLKELNSSMMTEQQILIDKIDAYINSADQEMFHLGLAILVEQPVNVAFAYFERYSLSRLGYYRSVEDFGKIEKYHETHFRVFNEKHRQYDGRDAHEVYEREGFCIVYNFIKHLGYTLRLYLNEHKLKEFKLEVGNGRRLHKLEQA